MRVPGAAGRVLAILSPSWESIVRSVPSPGLLLPGSRPNLFLSWICYGFDEVFGRLS